MILYDLPADDDTPRRTPNEVADEGAIEYDGFAVDVDSYGFKGVDERPVQGVSSDS